jgi:hypothetical protein
MHAVPIVDFVLYAYPPRCLVPIASIWRVPITCTRNEICPNHTFSCFKCTHVIYSVSFVLYDLLYIACVGSCSIDFGGPNNVTNIMATLGPFIALWQARGVPLKKGSYLFINILSFQNLLLPVRICCPTHNNLPKCNVVHFRHSIQDKNSYQDGDSPTGVSQVVGCSVGMI